MLTKIKQNKSGFNRFGNIWIYLMILWIFLWIAGAIIICLKVNSDALITLVVITFPFMTCGFLIPLLLFYNKSELTLDAIKERYTSNGLCRPKIISGLCYLYIPISIFAIIAVLLFPKSFQEYETKLGAAYSYITAFIFLLYLLSLIGYWFMKKWTVYLYIFTFVSSFFIHHYYFDLPVKIFGILGNLFIIGLGAKYILLLKEKG